MAVKVDTGEVELRVVSAYAPQMGCSEEEKACFWEDLEQYVQSLESEEVLLIGGDFNGHVGSRKDGFESCHGGYGYGARNDDGLRILEYAVASDLIIANTQYRKRKSHLITYTSGGRETQIDFWMLRRRDRRLLQDSKVIPTDHVAAQHHLLVMDLKISRPRKRHPRTETQRIKWWNLKDRKEAAIREKKSKYKLWWRTRQPEDRGAYLAAKKEAKKAVSKAKSDRYKAVYDMLDTREGERAVYRLVRARHRSTLDMEHTKIVKGADGTVLRRSGQILERWREYYNHLCNEEFCHPPIPTVPSIEGPVLPITAVEVSAALAKMKSNKATGPDDIPVDIWKLLGDRGSMWLATLFNKIVAEGRTPDVWQTSVTVPVWKGKGDIADCTSYRPIRLLCHTMKIFERVLEALLRKIVSVSLNQCGFVKDCSTIDAIHAVRILLEKHRGKKRREKNRSVHLAFLDLEKAFDRVPHELLWMSMRSHRVPEEYVRIDYWEMSPEQVIVKSEQLGHGAYGQVYKGKLVGPSPGILRYYKSEIAQFTDCDCAVKMLPKYASDSARAEFMHEIELMKTLGCHDNIVCMLGCITAANKSCLVIEYCASRDLLRYLKLRKTDLEINKSIDEQIECTKEFLNFAWQIAQGMSYLGQKNIIHRDLAARNILISGMGGMKNAKINDFGLSLSLDCSSQLPARGRLPIKWLALECLQRELFSMKSDVWSYGIVLFEMYSMGGRPFEDIEPLNLIAHLEAGNRPKRPLLATDKIAEVMTKCWDKVPGKRPSFEELLVVFASLLEQSTEGYGYLALMKTAEIYMALAEVNPPSKLEVADSSCHFRRSISDQADEDNTPLARKRAITYTTPASSIDSTGDTPDCDDEDAEENEEAAYNCYALSTSHPCETDTVSPETFDVTYVAWCRLHTLRKLLGDIPK
ncbi:hypothetical protein RB195_014349 [Necator americanus]|uniref:Protein kinase domain-containing protein n=1 Tax=Necator americanus TaxID=51031 RepID=A0ABR1E065_NECAM